MAKVQKEIICGVYKITNLVNGKFYIGSSNDVYKRWKGHKFDLKKGKHKNKHLQNAWNKYGAENFIFEIIEICIKEIQLIREQYWIDNTNCINREIGYNIAVNSSSPMKGRKMNEKQLLALSMRSKKMWESEEHRKNHSNKMKKLMEDEEYKSAYTQRLIKYNKSELNKERKSEEYKEKWKDEEYRESMSKMSKEVWQNEEYRNKMKTQRKGENNSNAKLTEKQVEEIKEKLVMGISIKEISQEYCIKEEHVRSIRRCKTWAYVKKELNEDLLKLVPPQQGGSRKKKN